MSGFEKVAKAVLNYADDDSWKAEITSQLEKRDQYGEYYANFMKLEQNCVTSGCFRNLAAMVYDQTEDTVYCARLYKKAEECSDFYDDYLLLGDGIHQHVGDQEWLRKIYSKMLKRWDDLAHVTKVVDRILLQISAADK